MVIKDTAYVSIIFDVNAEILLIKWKKKPSNKQLQDSYVAVFEYVDQTCMVTSFCTDLTDVGPLTREQEAWLVQEYYPKVYKSIRSGVHAAVVFSEEHFKAIVANFQQPTYLPQQDFINFNYFTKFQEATDWLVNIKKGLDTFSHVTP